MFFDRNEECTFAKVFFPNSEKEKADAPAYIVPDLPEDATEAQIEEAMQLEVCARPTCHLKCGALVLYMMGGGEAEIAQQVPGDCSWHEVPRVR